ncbi:MAG: rod shape-determining protein RodA [Candidatus Taylorbacteria bacterium]|nr:rod shape-determining protein RodA [Candidatus Taylorbacteria bacterium]
MNKIFSRLIPKDSLRESNSLLGIDWILFLSTIPLLGAGLVTMNAFTGNSHFFGKQLISIAISFTMFFILSRIDFRFLRSSFVTFSLYGGVCGILILLALIGGVTKGAQSWFDFGAFSFEPSDLAKLVLIIVLAKYFSRRHIEIANIRHIIVSGVYSFIIFFLIIIHPDFGSAILIFLIWLGMVLVSGISKKHLFLVFLVGAISFGGLWGFGFKEYQKNRIRTFVDPLSDIHGTGYNAYQSVIAVGSGQVVGKGVGYGTQSRLKFLPEYQTDFIFAAFAEEWGFIGILILFGCFAIVVWRILANAVLGATNFEILYGIGVAIFFVIHFSVNVGMNIGLLPVTGTTLPFLSYGGTHLLTEFTALGILMGMRRYRRNAHKDSIKNEFLGPQ